jgi:uncharacterized membrane protein YkvA (DUF1232 family)
MDWVVMLQSRLSSIAAGIKNEIKVLTYVARHPRLPLRCKFLAAFLVAYALSPIDPIPDIIPVLGQLDDLIITPVGIWILYKMVPRDILEEARNEIAHQDENSP